MSKEIQLWWELKVKPGKAGELRAISAALSASNQSEEPGTIIYNIYMNKEETLLTFVEAYTDADAMRMHAERFVAGAAGSVLECAEPIRMVIYGPVPQSTIDWGISQGFEFDVHQWVSGFVR